MICREPLFLQQFPNLGQSKHYRTAESTATTVQMLQIMIGILFIFSHRRSALRTPANSVAGDLIAGGRGAPTVPIHWPVLPFIRIDRLPADILLGEP